jgi:hypothetical protein
MGWVLNVTPRPLFPLERPDTLCIGDCDITSSEMKIIDDNELMIVN